jgi:hypothetical protein
MKPKIPTDLPTDPAEAYRRGWHDRSAVAGRKGGSVSSKAKKAAARANGAKGGWPKGRPAPLHQLPNLLLPRRLIPFAFGFLHELLVHLRYVFGGVVGLLHLGIFARRGENWQGEKWLIGVPFLGPSSPESRPFSSPSA